MQSKALASNALGRAIKSRQAASMAGIKQGTQNGTVLSKFQPPVAGWQSVYNRQHKQQVSMICTNARLSLPSSQLPACAGKSHQKRAYVSSVIKKNSRVPQCPTCGADFQNENPKVAGYLNDKKWAEMNSSNLTPQSLSSLAEEAIRKAENQAISSGNPDDTNDAQVGETKEKTHLDENAYQEMIKGIDDPELKALFTGSGHTPSSDSTGEASTLLENADNGSLSEEAALPFDVLSLARQKRKEGLGRTRIICQRCHTLKNYNRVDNPWKKDVVSDPKMLRFLKYRKDFLVVVVCDLFDIPGSLISNLDQYIGDRPVVLVANKADLLPRDYHAERLKAWLRRFTNILGVRIMSVHLISAQKNLGTRELAADLTELRRPGQDIYMIGRANVGKSEVLNALLRISVGGSMHRVLSSHIPGTTMGLYGVGIKHFLKSLVPVEGAKPQDRRAMFYDTPGIFSTKSIIAFLNNEELKLTICTKRTTPFTFVLRKGQTIMLGALGRVDLVAGPEKAYVTVFSAVRPHITKIERANELLELLHQGKNTILKPPVGNEERLQSFPAHNLALEHSFVGEHHKMASLDVAFTGIGWIAISGKFSNATIEVYTPFGTGAAVRPPMMPFEFKKLSPIMSNMRKTPK